MTTKDAIIMTLGTIVIGVGGLLLVLSIVTGYWFTG